METDDFDVDDILRNNKFAWCLFVPFLIELEFRTFDFFSF